jgi:signal transduction histidine kinase
MAHEIGNALVGIRTYTSMLPSHYEDAAFRTQFGERVTADVARIEDAIEVASRIAHRPGPARERVDVSALLAALLELRRARIRDRRLVVLEGLDRARPHAIGDAEQLRAGFDAVLDAVLGWVPERGDVFVSTRHDAAGPALRVEVRFRDPSPELGLLEHSLHVVDLEAIVQAQGGALALGHAGGESSIAIRLPAPPAASA